VFKKIFELMFNLVDDLILVQCRFWMWKTI